MLGLILNVSDDLLPPGSPFRTHEERRHQPALFVLDDGFPVFEVWFWHERLERWFCMSHSYDLERHRQGVVYFRTMDDLKAQLGALEGDAHAA